MIVSYDMINKNLKSLDEVKTKYPDFQRYDDLYNQNAIHSTPETREELSNLKAELIASGFAQYIQFIEIIKKYRNQDGSYSLIMTDNLKYKNIKKIITDNIAATTDNTKEGRIF